METIWLFGASRRGEIACETLQRRFDIAGFIDNDIGKQGATLQNRPVISLSSYTSRKGSSRIVIASQYAPAIIQQLIAEGIYEFGVFEGSRTPSNADGELIADIVDCRIPNNGEIKHDEIALMVSNASGSNTHAISRLSDLGSEPTTRTVYENEHSGERYIANATCGNIVCTHDTVTSDDRNYFQLWHGFPLKGLNHMSRYQSPRHRRDFQSYWSRYRAVASYSATYTTLMNACFGGAIEQYVITGMPRNDFLFRSDGKRELAKATGRDLSGKKLLAYMPTFRTTRFGQTNGRESGALFDFADFSLEEMIRFLDSQSLTMLVKLHPYEARETAAVQRMAESEAFCLITDEMLAAHHIDFYETLNSIDLLVTDYSSIYFDYLLLDRPIVFTPTDAKEYAATRGLLLEPYEFWAPGPKCLTQTELLSAIERELSSPNRLASERDRVSSIVHHYRDGNSSQRVAKMLREHLPKR